METKNWLFQFGVATGPKTKEDSKKATEVKKLVISVKLFDNVTSCIYLTLGDGSCAIPAKEYAIDTEKSSKELEKWFDIKSDDEGWLIINSKKHIYNSPPINSKKHMHGYYNYVCEWRRPLIMAPPMPIPVKAEPAKDWETNSLTRNANRITIDVFFKLHFFYF